MTQGFLMSELGSFLGVLMYTKALSVLFATASLLGASSVEKARAALKMLSPKGEVLAMAHFTVSENHPSDQKSRPTEQQFQVRLRSTRGELWVQWPETQDEGLPWAKDPKELRQLLDQGKVLQGWLDRCCPVTPTPKQNASSSPLVFRLPPEQPARLRRKLKEPEGTLQLWLDKDGMPQKAVLEQSYCGRAQRIAPDETLRTRLQVAFQQAGGRLVVRELEEDREERVGYDLVERHRRIALDPIVATE